MEPLQHCDTLNVDGSTTTANENDTQKEDEDSINKNVTEMNKAPEMKPDEILKNPQNVSNLYRQDVVQSNINGKSGIVTEVAGDPDSDSSITDDEDDDDGDDEEDDDAGSDKEGNADKNDKDDADAVKNSDRRNHKSNPLPADQVRVFWMDESETTESINDVTVVDRSFIYGNYVASVSDPTGQVGVVIDLNLSVDLLTHDGSVIKDVSSRDLKRVRDFAVGDHVVLGPWLGRIEDVLDNLTVRFNDGSVCKVTKADPLRLKPVDGNILEDGHFPYYPGQRVKAISSSVFKNSRWLSGSWRANRLEGTVTKVSVGSVFIYWIASAGYGPESFTTPAEEQNPKNLKLLSCFTHAIWQLGDWCILPSHLLPSAVPLETNLSKLELEDSTKDESEFAPTGDQRDLKVGTSEESNGNGEFMEINTEASLDKNNENTEKIINPTESCSSSGSLSVLKETPHETWPLHRKKIRKVVIRRDKKARKKEEKFERALLIVNSKSKVDVAWQDGKIERGRESTTLIPIDNPGDYEFVAEQYVVEKASDEDDYAGEVRRVGVVKSVNAKDRTACVRWLKPAMRAEDPKEFDIEEIVSVYELEAHPDYDYCYGDTVVRLSPVSVTAQLGSSAYLVEESNRPSDESEVKQDKKQDPGCQKEEGTSTDETCPEFSDLSWVGNITGLKNGDIEVTWADGMISTVGPQAIYVVGRDDDDSIAGSDLSDDAASWETMEEDEMATFQNDQEESAKGSASEFDPETEDNSEVADNSGRNGALAIPLAALGFMTRLASGIFSRGRKQTDSSSLDSRSEDGVDLQELYQKRDLGDESCSQKSDGVDGCVNLDTNGKREEHEIESPDLLDVADTLCSLKSEEAYSPSRCDKEKYSFKGFDITKEPYDHNFLGSAGQNNAGRKWLKKVQQDWNILQNNLPDGIYVRVYEDRMDLLRAVIVGAYGTPYQDGLFFFDFHLPPEYPDVPPSAYYHSGGWRINPNLYEEGKVCLSLLNTWTGKGNEVWDPSSSSILQVLVSLQGLVLNSKPYFNEAGYDKQIGTAEGEKNSLSYNENSFLLNCKTMLYLMRKPPKEFEELVKEHFRRRGYYILKACDAYMKGYLIGSLTKDASISSNDSSNSNSVGFKLMLAKIVPKLVVALSEIGAECEEFRHLQQV